MIEKPKAISLFTGAMGLDIGVENAGFDIVVALELNKVACNTIKLNRPNLPIINKNICETSSEEILSKGNIQKKDVKLIFGGPPCQSFSTAGKRQAFNDPKGDAMLHFIRLIEEIQPEYFLMENVKGLLSAALKHRPLSERGKEFPPLSEEEKPGSILKFIINKFEAIGYKVDYKLLNSANFGVPQTRERVFFLGSRDGHKISLPKETHSKNGENSLQNWIPLKDVLNSINTNNNNEFIKYNEERLKIMRLIPQGGGNWKNLPESLVKSAMGGAYKSGGGKVGFFRRLWIDKPSPTLLTSPCQKSTNLGHPYEDRPLSIKEYMKIQEFPDDWLFAGSLNEKYKQIGNAVPTRLGYIIAKQIYNHIIELEETFL